MWASPHCSFSQYLNIYFLISYLIYFVLLAPHNAAATNALIRTTALPIHTDSWGPVSYCSFSRDGERESFFQYSVFITVGSGPQEKRSYNPIQKMTDCAVAALHLFWIDNLFLDIRNIFIIIYLFRFIQTYSFGNLPFLIKLHR